MQGMEGVDDDEEDATGETGDLSAGGRCCCALRFLLAGDGVAPGVGVVVVAASVERIAPLPMLTLAALDGPSSGSSRIRSRATTMWRCLATRTLQSLSRRASQTTETRQSTLRATRFEGETMEKSDAWANACTDCIAPSPKKKEEKRDGADIAPAHP
jgi:hypothetical protein